ncbi:hypothetical protein LSM04_003746 [Trypanosoma melophagium]|uniref:uncharacterized protein n=1 Tax=Trypanosoma melophagium TaxID=715481 RepID=UPI00351A70C8|nr:hypothetical protein LSM04_003746 [Trypanosoma melophagium]
MAVPSYKAMKHSEYPNEIIFFIGNVVIFVLALAGLADTNLCRCLSQTLPPAEWCGERRSPHNAMQAVSVISLVGSLVLVASSVISLVTVRTRFVDIF